MKAVEAEETVGGCAVTVAAIMAVAVVTAATVAERTR